MSLWGYQPKWKKTPLLRGKVIPSKPRRQVRHVSSGRRKSLAVYIKTRDEWWPTVKGQLCPVMLEIFNRRVEVCNHPHHMYGRGKYECDTSTWLACSLVGHTWIENNKEEARQHGWLAPRGEWQNKKIERNV